MRSICFFATYYTSASMPYYVKVYVKELKKHFSKVIIYSSINSMTEEDTVFLNEAGIDYQYEKNEGFDFGMWYKAFHAHVLTDFDQVALVNDSCVLFKPLDGFMNWNKSCDADVKGMTLSEAITPHIQSFFMVLNKRAIALTEKYFKEHQIQKTIEEVIEVYELGLNRCFTEAGLKLAAYIDNRGYKGEFSPYYYCIEDHLAEGIPIIKKKILFVSYRKDELMNLARMGFNINPNKYYNLIASNKSELIIDTNILKAENKPLLSNLGMIEYNCIKALIKLFRPLYKLFKR